MSFIGSSYDEGEIIIPTVSETEHRLVQDLYDKVKGNKHMNNDLISREALRNSLLDSRPDNIEQSDINFDTCDIKIWLSSVLKTIDNAPTVGPRIEYGTDGQPYKLSISNGKEFERPQGEWKVYARQGGIPISDYCTNCKYEMRWYKNKYKFCPNCGAKMRNITETTSSCITTNPNSVEAYYQSLKGDAE